MKKNLSLLLAFIMLISVFPVMTNAVEFNTGVHQIFIDFENGESSIEPNGTPTSGNALIDREADSSALSDANGNFVYSLPVTNGTVTRSGGYIDFERVFGTGNVFNPGEKLIIECDYYNHGDSTVNGFGFSFPSVNASTGSVESNTEMRKPLLWWTKENRNKRYFVCRGSGWEGSKYLDPQPGWYTIKTEVYFASDASDSSWEKISFKKQGENTYSTLPKIMLDGTEVAPSEVNRNTLASSTGQQKYLGIFGTSDLVKNYIDNLKITLIEKDFYESIQSATDKNHIKASIADYSKLEGFEYLSGFATMDSAYKKHIAQSLLDNKASLTDNELVKSAYIDYSDDDIDNTLNIKGSAKLIKPMDNTTACVSYTVCDSYDDVISDVSWECTGAEILSDGTLLFNKNTPSSVTLTATDTAGVTAQKTVTFTNGAFVDFEDKTVGAKLDGDHNYGEVKSDGDKYGYFPLTDTGDGTYTIEDIGLGNIDGISDSINIAFSVKGDAGAGAYKLPIILGRPQTGASLWINESKYTVVQSGGSYIYTFDIENYLNAGTKTFAQKIITLPSNDWLRINFKIYPNTQKFDISFSGDTVNESLNDLGLMPLTDFNINGLRFRETAPRGSYDDISFYSGDIFPRVLTFAGSDIMTVNSDGGKKLLVASLTDNGIENTTHSVKWHLSGTSSDFTGNVSDVKISGANTLLVNGTPSGSIYVEGILDDNVTTTGIVEIKLKPAFSTVSENGSIAVNGTAGDTYNVKIYKPVSSDFISACLSYDAGNMVSDSLTIQLDGTGNLDISSLMTDDGMYMIEIVNSGDPSDSNVFEVYKNTNILPQADRDTLFSQNNISAYLLNFTNADSTLVSECISIYDSLSSNAKKAALRFCGNDIEDIYTSIYLSAVLDGDSLIADKCKAALDSEGLNGAVIPVLTANSEYTRIGNLIINESLISTALYSEEYLLEYTLSRAVGAVRDEIILTGVRQSANYPAGVSKYLNLLGNSYYNNGDASLKGAIHSKVAGKTYTDISLLNAAINSVPQPVVVPDDDGGSMGGSPVVNTSGTMPQIPPVTPQINEFKDVKSSHWAYSYVSYLAKGGIVTGYDGYYYPENTITRAEYAKLIYSAFNIPDASSAFFNDVTEDLWFYKPVNSLAAYGIITGYDGNFNPNIPISREDAAVIASRAIEKLGHSLPDNGAAFLDEKLISEYAKSAVQSLSAINILTGTPDGNYEPKRNITKAESGAVIYRILYWLAGGVK